MSDFAQGEPRTRILIGQLTLESRALYGAIYALFLARAALKRLIPLRPNRHNATNHETIFAEARAAASVMVASSFMGL